MRWLTRLFSRKFRYDELSATIEEHLAEKADDLMESGLSREEAERKARVEFGNPVVHQERSREVWQWPRLESFAEDVRQGLRQLTKAPVFTLTAVAALALGIGATSAVFSVVNTVILKPLVSGTNKLVEVWLHNPKAGGVEGYLPFDYPDYAYYRDHTKSLEGLMAFDGDGEDAIWNHAGTGEILHVQFVSGNLFSLLGLNAVAGRTLSADDDRIDNPRQVVVLSYPFWKQKLGGNPRIEKAVTSQSAARVLLA